jgi:hypothetical protein
MPGNELSQEKSQAKGQAKAKQGAKSSIALGTSIKTMDISKNSLKFYLRKFLN